MIRAGEPWGGPASGPPGIEVAGTDADLAAAVHRSPGARVWFRPTRSDLARSVGLAAGAAAPGTHEVPLDVLRAGDGVVAVNAVVLGTPPDRLGRWSRPASFTVVVDGRTVLDARATTIVVANGQYLRGLDVVPRGHPGDGRAEVQAYRLRGAQRKLLRGRLAAGAHLPHPDISQWSGRRIEVGVRGRPVALELDGVAAPAVTAWSCTVEPGAVRLLV
ncbi:MAG: hypothetical protein U0V73_09775 [Acidimicrobiia bacterium]